MLRVPTLMTLSLIREQRTSRKVFTKWGRNMSYGRRNLPGRFQSLEIYEFTDADTVLSEDGSKGPLRYFTGVVGNGCIMAGFLVIPNLMAAGRLSIKGESEGPKLSHNVPIAVSRKPSNFKNLRSGDSQGNRRRLAVQRSPERSLRASMSFLATSRAISNASVTVRP